MLAGGAAAQPYPAKPIRIIVPIPPGGAPDVTARVVGARLAEQLGQAVVIENRAGSNGNIAGELVARAAPDGYTLLLGQDTLITVNPHLYGKMPFDPLKDLVPVATLSIERVRVVGQSGSAGEDVAGIHRLCAQDLSAAALRVGRQWQPAPSRHGNVEAAGRDRAHAHSVQGRRAGDAGDGSGRHDGDVRGQLDGAADPRRQAARARCHRAAPLARISRSARDRRALSGIRSDHLARLVRARGHA